MRRDASPLLSKFVLGVAGAGVLEVAHSRLFLESLWAFLVCSSYLCYFLAGGGGTERGAGGGVRGGV